MIPFDPGPLKNSKWEVEDKKHICLCTTQKLTLFDNGRKHIHHNQHTKLPHSPSPLGPHNLCYYRWFLTTRDSWRTCSPSWGAGLLNDNAHQSLVFGGTIHCLVKQESLLWQCWGRWCEIRNPNYPPCPNEAEHTPMTSSKNRAQPVPSLDHCITPKKLRMHPH